MRIARRALQVGCPAILLGVAVTMFGFSARAQPDTSWGATDSVLGEFSERKTKLALSAGSTAFLKNGRYYCAVRHKEKRDRSLALRARFRIPSQCDATIIAAVSQPGSVSAGRLGVTRWIGDNSRRMDVSSVLPASVDLPGGMIDPAALAASGLLDAVLPAHPAPEVLAGCLAPTTAARSLWSEKLFAPQVEYLIITPAMGPDNCAPAILAHTGLLYDSGRVGATYGEYSETQAGIDRKVKSRRLNELNDRSDSGNWMELVARVTSTGMTGSEVVPCSAVILDDRHVVTAAHCLAHSGCRLIAVRELPEVFHSECESVAVDFRFRTPLSRGDMFSISIDGLFFAGDVDGAVLRLARPLTEFIEPQKLRQFLLEPIWGGTSTSVVGRKAMLYGHPRGDYLHITNRDCRIFFDKTPLGAGRRPEEKRVMQESGGRYYLSHSCASDGGHSGAALVDHNGTLLGIHLAVLKSRAGTTEGQGEHDPMADPELDDESNAFTDALCPIGALSRGIAS